MESVIGEIDIDNEIIMLATATGNFFVITLEQEMKNNIISGNFGHSGNRRIIALEHLEQKSILFGNIGHIVYEIITQERIEKMMNQVFARNFGHPMILAQKERNKVTYESFGLIDNEILLLERMRKMRNHVGHIGHLDNQMNIVLKNYITVGNFGHIDNAIETPAPRKVLHQLE